MQNAIVHRAVQLVAENAAALRVPALRGRGASATAIRCSICWRGPIRARTAPRFLEALYAHLLLAGNAYVEAVAVDGEPCASSTRCGPTACAWCRAPTAGRRPTTTPSPAAPCASTRARRRCRRSCISTLFHPLDDHYGLSAARSRRRRGRHPQRGGEVEQGAARQRGAALRRAGLFRAGRRGALRRASSSG